MNRLGETSGSGRYFRTERYIEINSLWYLVLRGGEQHGPFKSRESAQLSLQDLLKEANTSSDLVGRRRTRDRKRFKGLTKPNMSGAFMSNKVTRLPVRRDAEPARIEFTAVADDVHQVCADNNDSANDAVEDFSSKD